MRRLKTLRRPPIYPKTPGHLPCSSLTHPLPLPSPRPSVSFGGFWLTFVYYVNYELDIPGGTTIVPPIAVAIVLLGVLVAMPKLPDKVASMVQWTPAVAAVLLLLVPLGYDSAWEKTTVAVSPRISRTCDVL